MNGNAFTYGFAKGRRRLLSKVGKPIGGSKRPRDGDGDGMYSPGPGLPDKTPMPVALVTEAASGYRKAKRKNKSLTDILDFLGLDTGSSNPAKRRRALARAKKLRLAERPNLMGAGGPDQHGKGANRFVEAEVWKLQGFDGLPELIDPPEDLTNAIYRGLEAPSEETHKKYVTDFKEGDLFIGGGVYGSGIYTSSDIDTANLYSAIGNEKEQPDVEILTMIPVEEQEVIEFTELDKIRNRLLNEIGEREGLTSEVRRALASALRNTGMLAALLGYDAVSLMSGSQQILLLLNRTSVKVVK